MVCSIIVKEPESHGYSTYQHALHGIPRTSLTEVKAAVDAFWHRHGSVVSGFRGPAGKRTDDGERWFPGTLNRAHLDKLLHRMGGQTDEAQLPTEELITTFAAVYGWFDDPALRSAARNVSRAAYRFEARTLNGGMGLWSTVNSNLLAIVGPYHLGYTWCPGT